MRTERARARGWPVLACVCALVCALVSGLPGPGFAAPGRPAAGKPGAATLTPAQERRAMEDLAELYAQEGRTDEALALFAELRGRDPGEAKWWRRPAELLEPQADRHADLLLLLQGWRQAQPGLREPSERLVRFYEDDGAIDEGLKIVHALLATAPQDLSLLRLKAELLETGDRTDAAIAAWTAVLASPQATTEDRWRRADRMSVKGDSPALRAEYQALVAQKPDDVRFRVALGESLLAANDLPGAEAQLEAAVGRAPEDKDVRALAAAVEAERAERAADQHEDQFGERDALRGRLDRAERLRALLPQGDY